MTVQIAATLKPLTLGTPQVFQNLALFPLLNGAETRADYSMLADALKGGQVRVTEVSAGGVVPELLLDNASPGRVLLLDGDELVGAKQNRVLNITILVGANQKIVIPVSCVERGRWSARSSEFRSEDRMMFAKGRASKMAQVSRSIRESGTRHSDQRAVWDAVDAKTTLFQAAAPTGAMSDVYDHVAGDVRDYRVAFQAVPRQVGAVFALDGRPVGLELFDASATFASTLGRLVESYALDAIERPEPALSGTGLRACDGVPCPGLQRSGRGGEGGGRGRGRAPRGPGARGGGARRRWSRRAPLGARDGAQKEGGRSRPASGRGESRAAVGSTPGPVAQRMHFRYNGCTIQTGREPRLDDPWPTPARAGSVAMPRDGDPMSEHLAVRPGPLRRGLDDLPGSSGPVIAGEAAAALARPGQPHHPPVGVGTRVAGALRSPSPGPRRHRLLALPVPGAVDAPARGELPRGVHRHVPWPGCSPPAPFARPSTRRSPRTPRSMASTGSTRRCCGSPGPGPRGKLDPRVAAVLRLPGARTGPGRERMGWDDGDGILDLGAFLLKSDAEWLATWRSELDAEVDRRASVEGHGRGVRRGDTCLRGGVPAHAGPAPARRRDRGALGRRGAPDP